MESVQNSPLSKGHITPSRLLWAAPLTALANALVYLIAGVVGAIPSDFVIPGPGTPLTLGMVVGSTVVPALLAGVVFALLGRFTRRPVRNFVVLAAVLLVLSFVTPLTIPGAPLSMVLALELMHVVAAVVIVGGLTTLARRR
ncbi:MAG: DUF6069 family protein [Actinomycetota bacterium]|nr:DUF6069 family protein [Actinomycetota bacterium]